MEIILNGRKRETEDSISIKDLITSLELNEKMVVVELNEAIVKKEVYEATTLKPDDQLEILRFVGGG